MDTIKTPVLLKFYKMRQYSNNRHPTIKSVRKPTDAPSLVSCGKKEIELMRYIKNLNGSRFNKVAVSRPITKGGLGIARSSVYDLLNKLQSKDLIILSLANAELTKKGIDYLDSTFEGVQSYRQECRSAGLGKLSTHKSDFVMDIKNIDFGAFEKLSTLKPINHRIPKWKNNPQHHLYFDGLTISVFSKKVIFRVHDILSDNTGQNEYDAFLRVCEFIDKLSSIGIRGDGVYLESAHYSHIDSYLAGFLIKIDNKYTLELSNGSKVWVDHSKPNGLEDETDKKEHRERIDKFMDDMIITAKSNMSDVDNLLSDVKAQKEITDNLVKISSNLIKLELVRNQPIEYKSPTGDIRNYFG